MEIYWIMEGEQGRIEQQSQKTGISMLSIAQLPSD